MKRHTEALFLRPLLFQELVTYIVLVPPVFFFFMKISPAIRENMMLKAFSYVLMQSVISIALGAWVKYRFVRPSIALLEGDRHDERDIRRALRSASILPVAEAIVIYFRWACIAWCSVIIPFYLQGTISFEMLIFGGNILGMSGVSAMALYYLSAENSLAPFYQWCSRQGIFGEGTKAITINLNLKLIGMIFLITLPPIGDLLGIVYLSIFTGLDLSSIQFGFLLLLLQTAVMIVLNGLLLMKGLTRSVRRMSIMLREMAKGRGDLTKRLDVSNADEVGDLAHWFNDFMGSLEGIIARVRVTSLQLHEFIEQVNAGSQDLSHATQEQAASVQQISASIEEMNGSVRHNAELIQEGYDSSSAATKLIDHTKNIFSDLLCAIGEISQDSKKVEEIVTTVNDVAFHTNILALNASVEAARAGEHGKGFAVVAGEVRSLAQRSALAAGEIRSLIGKTVDRIRNGDEMMKKTAVSLEELVKHMEIFFRMIETVSVSSREQAQNIGELNRGIAQIDGAAQHNASKVEELAGVLETLRTAATVLAEDVRQFKTSVE